MAANGVASSNPMRGRKMTDMMNRRKFLETAAASACFTIIPRHVLGGTGVVPPSDKITLAHIGTGTVGGNIGQG